MTDKLAALETVGSGSYATADVHFLLRAVEVDTTDIEEKERLIQSGQKHYSDMISLERPPSEMHMALYTQAMERNSCRMSKDIQSLAQALHTLYAGEPLALVSFVRAGLPPGVLLRRALEGMGQDTRHYGISIVRDRGIDTVALDAVIEAHGAANIVFVDGWTGKGAIAGELQTALSQDPRFPEKPRLVVLADPCGRAWLAASADDWVIPSGILGATVSGLVSRSIWPTDDGLHGCVVYDHLREHDMTRAFIDHIDAERVQLGPVASATPWSESKKESLQIKASGVISMLAERFDVTNVNRIKPGIAEATRAVLRRVPDRVLVRDRGDADVQLLQYLTDRAGVAVEEVGDDIAPYKAVTIIKAVGQ
ncbi:MAG: cysteine protease StiP family protein [Oceanospirillales bacterium]|nr:cysteine protease StiP family protein [Oceanospirillales bacterium]